ncbi:hybrid sensor histidine kinase/response regulator [Candidatus Chloroploca sp. Khr17]|uniref:hybrid sensor histidine kinase/response regulator n=1 Tax=Candidatus Chloroploca sp. Khr17 TaxID=2496869 RepID=UPI00101C8815|nr:hybrid sensor histidine kinase/response regulator [Candidatus Chloroploca sp. Khr17]
MVPASHSTSQQTLRDDPLVVWRQRTISLLLKIFAFIGIPVLLFDAFLHLQFGRWPMAVWSFCFAVLVVVLALLPRLDDRLRSFLLLGSFLFGCLLALATMGFYGINAALLALNVVLAVLLLGSRPALVIGILGSMGVALVFAGFASGFLPYPYVALSNVTDPRVLTNNVLLIIAIAAGLGLMVNSLLAALQTSLQTTRATLAELERVNASLDAKVDQRTAEVRRALSLLEATQHITSVGGVAYGPRDGLITWTDELYRIHEVPLGTVIDQALLQQLYPPEAWATLRQACDRLEATGEPYDLELPSLTLAGRPIWVRLLGKIEASSGVPHYAGAVQDITSYKQAAQRMSRQLQYAEALAQCSRILLIAVENEQALQQTLNEALGIVREAVDADRISLARYPHYALGEATLKRAFQNLAGNDRPGLPPARPFPAEAVRDLPPVLNVWQQGGGMYNGPVAGQFPDHPIYQGACESSGLKSLCIQAVQLQERWWGHIMLFDYQRCRSWDAGALQLLRTAAEMIVTFVEGWEAARALQEREALLREVGQIARVGGWTLDCPTWRVQWSEQVYAIHDLPVGEPPPLDEAINFYAPEARPVLQAAINEGLEHGTPWDLELPFITAQGRRIWVRAQGQPVIREGVVVQLSGTVQEITVRKEAELALARELRYAEVLEQCSRMLLVASTDVADWQPVVQQAIALLRQAIGCTRLSINLFPVADETFRIAEHKLVAQDQAASPYQACPVEFVDIPPELLEHLQRGKSITGLIDDLVPPDSSLYAYFHANQRPNLCLAGVFINGIWRGYLVASDRDATRPWDEPTIRLLHTAVEMISAFLQQWEMSSDLRRREAQLRAVGDNLPNGFIYQYRHDQTMQPSYLFISGGVQQVLGVAPEEVFVDSSVLHDLISPDERERVLVAQLHSFKAMSLFNEVVHFILPDGTERWLYISSRPRREADGSIVWDGLSLDITERQQAAHELAQARDAAEAATRAKSAFLAHMSHEIRTPLNAVLGMTALLRDSELTAEQRLLTDTINTGGQALLVVLSDILDLSRIESGRLELALAPFDLYASLAATVDLVKHTAQAKGLTVGYTYTPDLPRVLVGDEARLRQVLLNLLGNAVKFTNQGKVTLTADAFPCADGTVLITFEVRDTGIGMTAAQSEHIFEPFVQVDNNASRRYGGTGLGLAITRQLLDLMHGTVEVASSPRVGTTFTVRVPFALATEDLLPQPVELHVQFDHPLQILIAEDNPINQQVIDRVVRRMGHQVTMVNNGQRALEAVKQHPYDVILMDMQMPELDGETATRMIRELGTTINQPRIIALTADTLEANRQRALQAGMDDYLCKPVQLSDLKRVLGDAPLGNQPEPEALPLCPQPHEAIFDWKILDQLQAALGSDGPEAIATMIDLFEESIPSQIAALETAAVEHDRARLQAEAHRLRGGSRQMGAQAMGSICQQIEDVRSDNDVPTLIDQLRRCYAQTRSVLRQRYPDA